MDQQHREEEHRRAQAQPKYASRPTQILPVPAPKVEHRAGDDRSREKKQQYAKVWHRGLGKRGLAQASRRFCGILERDNLVRGLVRKQRAHQLIV